MKTPAKNWLRRAFSRIGAFFSKKPLDRELDEEMASHLEFATDELTKRGLPRAEAERQARVRFGNVGQAQEHHRATRGLPGADILLQDLRFTFRTLRRDASFTVIAVLILALGIGANIAVFSVVHTILLRPLPFSAPEQLVRIRQNDPKGGESSMTYTVDAMQELARQTKTLQAVTGYFAFSGPENVKLMGNGQPQPVTGLTVAGNFFQTLGVQPVLGRDFVDEESLKNSRPVVLLANPFWKQHFAGDASVVGQAIDLDGTPVTVIGVLPASFDFGSVFAPGAKVDLFVPAILGNMEDWGNTMALVGRLKPGIPLSQAQLEADSLFPRLHQNLKHPYPNDGYTAQLFGMKEYVSGKLRESLLVLWCAVGMILLIVCVNLSNLLLAKAATRQREFALRSALGAGRGRIMRQLLTESLILSCAGALLGLGMAFSVTSWLAHQSAIALPLLSSVHVESAALEWALLLTVASALLFGITPALRMSDRNLHEALKDAGQGASQGRSHDRVRSVLVISEVALSCVLLVGAGLLMRSFLRLLDVDLGFQPSHAAAISVTYDDGGNFLKRAAIQQQMLQRIEQIPGVETAGITDSLPMSTNRSWDISAKGRTYANGELQDTFVYVVTPGYLNAIRLRLVEGRDIRWDDADPKQAVVIVNQTIARNLWPHEDPVGKIASIGGTDAQVIGVVADVHETSAETVGGWQMYVSQTCPQFSSNAPELVVRTKLPPDSLALSVMGVLREMNPGQPATEFRPIQQLVDHASSPRRFFVLLVGVFAALGVILASLGIYGVISYSVTRQTKEIGIRMALGATAGSVMSGVIAKTLRLALAGVFIGTILSLALSRMIATLLFGTAPTDPVTFAAMVLLLAGVALTAGYIPARRASRINPTIALRNS